MTMDNKSILQLLKQGGISAALIAILLYFGTALYTKLSELQKDVISIRIELTQMQSTLINREDVQTLVDKKIDAKVRELQLKYHR